MNEAGRARRDRFFAAIAGGPVLMGIVNATPDSFSDGGRFQTAEAACAETERHLAGGAAIVDLGAESTRPGHVPVSQDEELVRLDPVLAAVCAVATVSIDTTKPVVAARALAAGAVVVNDQWGLQRDPDVALRMGEVVADGEAGLVLMHNPATADAETDVVDAMRRFFDRSLTVAGRAGIPGDRLILDPGIGFGKTKAQNLRALGAGVAALRATFGLPILVGASRKSLFATLIGAAAVEDRLTGTLAAHLAAYAHGARVFRVHDCAAHRDALAVTQAIAGPGNG